MRSFGNGAKPQVQEGSRLIEGYAVVFGVRSQVMYDYKAGQYFEEVIHREAITPELLQRSDIKAVMEHNVERLLARSNRGEGSLRLSVDEVGLRYSFEAPETTDGNDALELVRRGDLSGSSFAFRSTTPSYTVRTWDKERRIWLYERKGFDSLHDVSITADPAYVQTSVDVRSLSEPESEPIARGVVDQKTRRALRLLGQ